MLLMDVVGFIRAEMKEKNIPVAKMADKLGYHRATLYYWFNGDRQMPFTAINSALDILGCKLEINKK